jgi:outer membrane protein assembly factor BamB
VLAAGVSASALLSWVSPAAAAPAAGGDRAASPLAAITSQNWTVYHRNLLGSGMDTSGTSFSLATAAWTSPTLDGQLYGEPLVHGTRVFVATENDTVYALSAVNGSIVWSRHLGTAVPATDLPCGDIQPDVGITGTPVIDSGRKEIFVVADELVGGAPTHVLVGLGLGSGAVEMSQPVDPAGSTPAAQLQRTGLTLDQGQVVFGYGGNAGDCGPYHGWVVAVPESGGPMRTFEVDAAAGERQGAIWMGGAAPLVDSTGDVWVAAGNGSVRTPTGPYDGSDAVIELSSSLHELQFFAPADWATQNGSDQDLGSSSPALLSNGYVLQVGKSDTAYLLHEAALGGIGGQATEVTSICGGVVDGGEAFSGNVVYAPCSVGVEALRVGTSPPSVTKLWQTSTGSKGPAILAGGLVWTLSLSGVLSGLDPTSGATKQQLRTGSLSNHFPTPSVGDHLLLVAASTDVVAFKGPG